MTDREIFRKNFIELLRITKVRQRDLSKQIGVSFQTVSAWATGRGYPRPEAMEKICQYFGIKPSALTEDPNSEETQEQKLIEYFRSLSDIGKEKALERVSEMVIVYPKRSKKNG